MPTDKTRQIEASKIRSIRVRKNGCCCFVRELLPTHAKRKSRYEDRSAFIPDTWFETPIEIPIYENDTHLQGVFASINSATYQPPNKIAVHT